MSHADLRGTSVKERLTPGWKPDVQLDMTALSRTVLVSLTKNQQALRSSSGDTVKGKSSSNSKFGK